MQQVEDTDGAGQQHEGEEIDKMSIEKLCCEINKMSLTPVGKHGVQVEIVDEFARDIFSPDEASSNGYNARKNSVPLTTATNSPMEQPRHKQLNSFSFPPNYQAALALLSSSEANVSKRMQSYSTHNQLDKVPNHLGRFASRP